MTERCVYCEGVTGYDNKSDYYKLNDQVFCSIPCFNESLKDAKLINKPKVQPRKTVKKSKSKKVKSKNGK